MYLSEFIPNLENKGIPMQKRQKPLKQWQAMLKRIFGEKNKRDSDSADLLLHVVEEASACAESLRKENGALESPIAHMFSWLIAFATSLEIDMEEAVFQKYHGSCPYCGRKRNCICISSEKKPSRWFRDRSAKVPRSLAKWQRLFERIYGNVNKVAGREKIWLHLLEEIGDVSKAQRRKRMKTIKEELADVFAWLCSLSNLLGIDLDEIVSKTYPGKCDVCKKTTCICPLV